MKRSDQIFAAFEKFHRDNPTVWKLFESFSLDLIGKGFEHYSSDAIYHRIRWHFDVETTGSELKLNDHFTAYYARMFHAAHPEHDGFFRNRERISEHAAAYEHDQQVFIGPEAGDESDLTEKLAELSKL